MNKNAQIKFAEGFNRYVANWNNKVSDYGKAPYRRGTAAHDGYEAARANNLAAQVQSKTPVFSTITPDQAEATRAAWDAMYKPGGVFGL